MKRKYLVLFVVLYLSSLIISGQPFIHHNFTDEEYSLDVIHVSLGGLYSMHEGALVLSFELELKAYFPMGSFFSGYDSVTLDANFPVQGTLHLTLVDIFEDEFSTSINVEAGREEIILSREEFYPYADIGATTVEYIAVQFQTSQAGIHDLQLYSLGFSDPQPFRGPWIAVDPVFSFYQGMDWNDFAQKVKNKGFLGVQIISIWANPTISQQASLVGSFHQNGLICVLRMYPSTDLYAHQNYPHWRQKMLDGSSGHDWRVYLCPNSDEFTQHQKNRVESIMQTVPYDAIELAENWFEIWGGPYPDNANRGKYACICDNCRNKFMAVSDVDPVGLFDEESEYYFLDEENQALYEQWVQFRIDSLITFADELFESAKSRRPAVKTVHMHLSDCTVEPGKSAEYQGQDLSAAVNALQPDIVIIQDAWQDWIQPGLSPDFVTSYGDYYVDKVLNIKPDVKLIVHADIGSLDRMRRSFDWMRRMNAHALTAGFHGVDFYEYSVGNFSIPAPSILSPQPGEIQTFPLNLHGSSFEQLNWTADHRQTYWEIALDQYFTSPIWSSIVQTPPLETATVSFVLPGKEENFYLRTRYRNSFWHWSEWSEPVGFSIIYTQVRGWSIFN